MAYKLKDLCKLKEDYDKKAEKYFLARKMNGEYLRFTEIRITSKIQDENVDMPINGDLFRKIMDLVLNYYKGDLKEIEEKIKSITDCLIIEPVQKENEKKITVEELVELIKQSFDILPFDKKGNPKSYYNEDKIYGELTGETSFCFDVRQYSPNDIISWLYKIIYEKGYLEDGLCVVEGTSQFYTYVSVFKKDSYALGQFEKRDCRWYVLNGDDID